MNEIAMRLAARLFDRPLIQNQYRSAFVEAMLEPLIVPHGWRHVGDNWAGCDFEHVTGMRLEVKQSAAWQTWSKSREGGKIGGRGVFDIASRTGWFDETGATWTKESGRRAHIYIFAWNPAIEDAADHREPGQWEFFIVLSDNLPAQKTLSLGRLRLIAGGKSYAGPESCAEALAFCVKRSNLVPQ